MEDSQHVFVEDHQARRRSTMLPTSAAPIRIGAAIVEPSSEEGDDEVLAGTMRGADKRRAERLEMREMLLR
jgi:hypothetical protein